MRKWKSRREVKEAHEQFTLDLFLEHLNRRHRSHFQIVEKPDPPDAIIQSSKTVRWVEVVAAFWDATYAQDLASYVTKGEPHKSIGDGLIFVNPTAIPPQSSSKTSRI